MSLNKTKHPLQLLKYFVFNSDWGQREGYEHEKLIYYYSKTPANADEQVSDIGLAEAVVNFATQFGDEAESLHGSKLRFVVHRLEDNVWSALCISEPYSVRRSTDDATQFIEYHDQEICSRFLSLKLQNIANYFRLLNGPINELLQSLPKEEFILKCCKFFDYYVPHLEMLPLNLIELFGSIQYLPLNNTTFMQVQSLLNCVQSLDSSILTSFLFLYNEYLVTSSMSLEDTKILYNYLTNLIIPDAVKDEINGIGHKTRWIQTDTKIYLSQEQQFRSLCLFRSVNGSTIALILKHFDSHILADCEALLSSKLVNLTTKLQENVQQLTRNTADPRASSLEGVRFVYVNQTNAAQRGTENCRKMIDGDFSRLILDLESDLVEFGEDSNVFELVGKNTNDAWLVMKNTDLRTLFVMLNHKNSNLIEANDSVEQLRKRHLNTVFFGV